jgi:hypothetical protein
MKTYAHSDDALARSLIGQMLAELMRAWSDYEETDGVFYRRDAVRALIAAALAQLDEAPMRVPVAVALVPDGLRDRAEAVPRDRSWSWHEWMLVAAAWYFGALATDYVRARPALYAALRDLAFRHAAQIGDSGKPMPERSKQPFMARGRGRRLDAVRSHASA